MKQHTILYQIVIKLDGDFDNRISLYPNIYRRIESLPNLKERKINIHDISG